MVSRDLEYMTPLMATPLLAQVADLARMLHALRLSVESGEDCLKPQFALSLLVCSFFLNSLTLNSLTSFRF